jgi:zinc protease
MGPLTTVHRTEVDGVPASWADAPGPFFAGLLFRVGKIDEQLHTAGITHLVEHLALPAWAPKPGLSWNGFVSLTTTGFWAAGEPSAVGGFLEEVTRRLHDLPLARLETERGILRAEEASASRSASGVLSGLRFGAVGIGLLDWFELGLRRLEGDEVARWASERFTRGNAALWLNGPPPPELRLHLPDGPRLPPPRHAEPDEELPAFSRWGRGGVSISLWAPRSYPLGLAWISAERRALSRLRYERGLIYGLSAWNDAPNKHDAHIVFVAECTDENVDAVRAGLLDVLEEVAEDGPTLDEHAEWVHGIETDLSDPHEALSVAYGQAEDLLFDRLQPLEQRLEAFRAGATADAASALRQALRRAILLIPEEDAEDPPAPFRPFAPAATANVRVDGRKFPVSGIRGLVGRGGHAVLGEHALAWRPPDGDGMTIAFADAAALMTWRDGSFQLVDANGNFLLLDPDDVRNGSELAAGVRRAVPPERVIPMD